MSCSDKIAIWVCVGLQGGLLADLYEKVKLEGLVIGGVEQPPEWTDRKNVWEDKIKAEAARALYGRLESIKCTLFLTTARTIYRWLTSTSHATERVSFT